MTKRRDPLTFADAMHRIIGELGAAECAHLADVSERAIYEWSDPDLPVTPQMRHALRLDIAFNERTGDGFPLRDSYELQARVAVAERTSGIVQLARAAAAIVKEGGEAGAALFHCLTPGASIAERALARREIEENIAALTKALAMLEQDGRPAPAIEAPS